MSTLANAVDVLKLIARLRRSITVTDLVAEMAMPKSSASRTLSTMAAHGLLDRDETTRAYRPGRAIMEAAFHFRSSENTVSLLEEAVDSLVAASGYTGYINVLDGADSLVIQMRTGAGSLQVYTPPGTRAPAYATSIGRAILARLTDDDAVALLGPRLEVRRGQVPRTRKDLLARLAQVRSSGWSLSRGEYVPNVAGISAAVQDPSTRQIYGLGIALPVQDLSERLIERFSTLVVETAREVGTRVGDTYWLNLATTA